MDPITISLLALLLLGGGGFFWYEKWGPGAAASALPAPRQITLDNNLPDADKQSVIAAIMSGTLASVQQLAAKYATYPWASYELNYRIWELSGSQGAPPAQPASGGTPTATPQPAPVPSSQSGQPNNLAQSAVNTAITASQTTPTVPPAPPTGKPVPSAGPFDLSHATIHLAWQTDKAYIKAYQGALTFLAYKYQQAAWDPQGVDGNFGPNTQAAVKAFQTAKSIKTAAGTYDGEAGKDTATAIAAALTATSTAGLGEDQVSGLGEDQVSGQGSYAAFPAGGTGPGDSRYGARGHGLDQIAGLGEDQVSGLGEDQVSGLGEDQVSGLGEVVQGMGEDEVQGLPLAGGMTPTQIQAAAVAEANKKKVASLPHAKQQHVGQGIGSAILGAGQTAPLTNLAAAAAAMAGHGGAAVPRTIVPMQAHTPPGRRPAGGWFIHMRPEDKIWPRKIAEIGSGVPRGTQGSIQHLADINPHLSPGGVMRQLVAGDQVNIPGSWATPLRQKGLDIRSDHHVEGAMGLGGD